jgi:hypothetical protein
MFARVWLIWDVPFVPERAGLALGRPHDGVLCARNATSATLVGHTRRRAFYKTFAGFARRERQ